MTSHITRQIKYGLSCVSAWCLNGESQQALIVATSVGFVNYLMSQSLVDSFCVGITGFYLSAFQSGAVQMNVENGADVSKNHSPFFMNTVATCFVCSSTVATLLCVLNYSHTHMQRRGPYVSVGAILGCWAKMLANSYDNARREALKESSLDYDRGLTFYSVLGSIFGAYVSAYLYKNDPEISTY
eukprot:88662_1